MPYANVPSLAAGNNVSFDTIEIEAGTLSGELDLNWIWDRDNQPQLRPGGRLYLGSRRTLAVGAGVPVVILAGETLTDNGTIPFASGDTVSFASNGFGGGYGKIVVVGILEIAGTTINSGGSITVDSDGILEGNGSHFGMSQLTLGSGANATLHFNTFTVSLAIDSGATINIVGNNFSGVGNNGISATGTPSAHIPLTNNYWATTDTTAIGKLILDHNDAPTTRPYVDFQPVWVNASGTIATPLTVIYSASDQDLTLSAAVETTGGILINGGTETFTILNSSGQQVGQSTVAQNVLNGAVSAAYKLPGGTAVGQYTIKAVFSGGGGFPAATDTTQYLTITPLASQVAITSTALNQTAGVLGAITVQLEDSNGNTGATSTTDQTINLSTTSSAGVFDVNQSGGNPITSIVIPAGHSTAIVYYADTQAGIPTVTAADSAFNSSSHQNETINPAAVSSFTVTTTYASPDVAGTAGTVTVTAYDTYGNIVGSGPNQFTGAVSLSSTDSKKSGLPSSYTFTAGDAGSHAFTNVILKTAGNQTFTATYVGHPTATGTSAAVNVVPAPASVVAITSAPLTLTTGTRGAMTVQLEDVYGNTGATSTSDQTIKLTTTSSAGVFYASQSGGNPITSVSIAAGQNAATVYYADTKTGTPTVTAADTAFNSSPTQKETIKVGDASQVVITSAGRRLHRGRPWRPDHRPARGQLREYRGHLDQRPDDQPEHHQLGRRLLCSLVQGAAPSPAS